MIFIDNQASRRIKDDNGFLIIKDNPIAKAGVFDYLLSEITGEKQEHDKIVKVYRPLDELERIKNSFENKPIVLGHNWVGAENKVADGAIGSNISVDKENGYLRADLIIYNPDLISAIEKNEIVELSPAYTGSIDNENGRYNGEGYEYRQNLGCINHLAVVERGRSGSDLRIADKALNTDDLKNTNSQKGDKMEAFKKQFLAGIGAFMDKCAVKDEDETGKVTEEEKDKKVTDEEKDKKVTDEENGDKQEVSSTQKEKVCDSDSESKDEKESSDKKEKEFADSLLKSVEALIDKKLNSFADSQKAELKIINDAYNEVSEALGTSFDYSGMSRDELYKFGYETITGVKLADDMDSVTAFKLANAHNKPAQKVEDSAPATKETESAILKALNNF